MNFVGVEWRFAVTCVWLFATSERSYADAWTQTSAPSNHWVAIAASADGTKLVAAANLPPIIPLPDPRPGPIFLSTNSGATWFLSGAPSNRWFSVASSADGSKLVAAGYPFGVSVAGPIYTSSDYGLNWTQTSAPSNRWTCLASSADGTKLAATIYGGRIHTSTNAGATWTETSAQVQDWYGVASSADGSKLAAVVYDTFPSGIFATTNSGQNWTQTSAPIKSWRAIASSADGAKLTALVFNGSGIFTSSDSGANWKSNSAPRKGWTAVASSADGQQLIAAAPFTVSAADIYTSVDSGTSWAPAGMPVLSWSAVATSADGAKLFAAVNGGGIYTSQSAPAPVLQMARPATNQVLLSWTVPSATFTLQRNSDASTTNWLTVTNVPVLNMTNLQNEVVLPMSAESTFYRLIAE